MVKIRGAKVHSARLKRMASSTRRDVGAALYAAGNLIEVEAEHSITEGSISGPDHVPSLPGEPPNADTRQLDTSIETIKVDETHTEVEAVGPYAAALEFGTSDGKLAERPYLRPATKRKRAEAVDLVRRAVNRTTK